MTALPRRDRVEIAIYALVAVVGGLVLAAVLEVAYAVFLVAGGADFEGILSGTLAAGGVIEPATTKLLPALFVVYMVRSQVPAASGIFHRRWLLFGLAIGLSVGLLEFLTKLPLLTSEAGSPTLVVCALAPALLLHPLMGLLVAAPAFRVADAASGWSDRRRWLAILVVGVALAMAIHVWWNTGGATTVVGQISSDCEMGL
jgi:hypothetical protein